MGIQTETGLVSGIPIVDTVDQLMAISARPRDRLEARNYAMQQQQVAIGELTALTIAIQMSANNLAKESVFEQRVASSSNDDLLGAAITGDAVAGQYEFTPVRTAQTHQMISGGVATVDEPLSEGQLSIAFGGFVDQSLDLDALNGGQGVERGKIRITDRSGASQIVDLRTALTVEDVLQTINSSEDINVAAVAVGDAIQLVDQTGQTTSNLKVQDVGLGSTAADLGLSGIDVAADSATGEDLVRLHDDLAIHRLRGGIGLDIRAELPDLEISFRDGSDSLQIDLDPAEVTTLGELVDALNAADPTRLEAELSSDGDRLVLRDLTVDMGGPFEVTSPVGGMLAEELGFTNTAGGDEISGNRILGGLKTPLLSSLSGGGGLGPLGQISLTDRAGDSATISLGNAETLDDVVQAINNSGVGITATVNDARNGIQLEDTTGATNSNLIVANADASNSADALNIAVDTDDNSVDSGSLALQQISRRTRLSSLNHGAGVSLGSFLISDTSGSQTGINLKTSEAETVGDVIDLINGMDIGVEARINDSGDGILLVDTAGGSGKISVTESGNGSTAADLRLLGESVEVDIEGTPTQVIDGSATATFSVEEGETLEDLITRINEADVGVTAGIFQSGSGSTPYRISLVSEYAGRAGEMLVDASQLGLDLHTIVTPQDALLQVGSADMPGAGVLVTSSDNRFDDVIQGVQLTVNGAAGSAVTVDVSASDAKLVSNVKLFVSQYNSLQAKLDELTYFNEESGSTGILFGTNEALRVETTLSNLATGRFFGVGSIQSLEEVGISFKDDGTIELDEDKLSERFAEDPESVQQFFTDEELGVAAKFNAAVESLAGENNSLLVARNQALQRRIETNSDRIEFMDDRLEAERERLLKEYYAMETAIAKIQSNMSAVNSIVALAPLTSSGDS
jgi:flagellar hook-associated protein 2